MKARVAAGTHQGWQSRKMRSYAEKFFETVLVENKIKFDVEFKIKKADLGLNCSMNYFLDFYLPEYNLDLEIDGKQHEYAERKIKDEIRDKALSDNGMRVYRIKWKNPINEVNKKYINLEIKRFIDYLKNSGVFQADGNTGRPRTSDFAGSNPVTPTKENYYMGV